MRSIPAIVFSAALLAALACGAPAQSSNPPPDPISRPQEDVIATAIAVALTDTAPPTATPPRATARPPGPTSRATRPTATIGATAAPTPPGPTNTASPAMVLTTRVKPTATTQPTRAPRPTPVPIYTDPNFDLNQFAQDPTLGIWWERTAEDLGHTDVPWITPLATVENHPYFGGYYWVNVSTSHFNRVISPFLAAYAIDFMATQDYEFPVERKDEKDLIAGSIGASLRFEILSPDLPIVRFQAMFPADKETEYKSYTNTDYQKAFLMGGVLVLDWIARIREDPADTYYYLGPREVIGSLIFEPAEEYKNRRGR